MVERDRSHILIPGLATSERYSPPPRSIPTSPRRVPQSRGRHGERLTAELNEADRLGRDRRDNASLGIEGVVDGIYVTFESFDGLAGALQSLDPSPWIHRPDS